MAKSISIFRKALALHLLLLIAFTVPATALEQPLSPEVQFQKIEQLIWDNKLSDGQFQLVTFLRSHPNHLHARLLLAEILTWQGRVLEAEVQVNRVLTQNPHHPKALRIKGDSLLWRGNPGSALVYYQHASSKREGFLSALGVAYSNLDAGNLVAAQEAKKQLAPITENHKASIEKLDTDLLQAAAKSADLSVRHYDDSDENQRFSVRSSIHVPSENVRWGITFDQTEVERFAGSSDVQQFSLGAQGPINHWWKLYGSLGGVAYEQSNAKPIGDIAAEYAGSRIWFRGQVEQAPLTDTLQIVEEQVRFTGATMHSRLRLNDEVHPRLQLQLRDYTDNNTSFKTRIDLPYSFRLMRPALELGVRYEFLSFRRQSGSGYFDPDELHSMLLFLGSNYHRDDYQLYLELFGGRQKTFRYDTSQNDTFAGIYGLFSYDIGKYVSIQAEFEGSDYSLATASGFRYITFLGGVALRL